MVLQFDCTGRAQADHDESAGCALIREYDASAAYRSAACAASTAPRTASAYPSASDASDASASDASARDAPQRPWVPVVIRMLTRKKENPPTYVYLQACIGTRDFSSAPPIYHLLLFVTDPRATVSRLHGGPHRTHICPVAAGPQVAQSIIMSHHESSRGRSSGGKMLGLGMGA